MVGHLSRIGVRQGPGSRRPPGRGEPHRLQHHHGAPAVEARQGPNLRICPTGPPASGRRAGDPHRVTYLQTDGFPHTAGSTVTSLTIQQASPWGSRRRPDPV